MDELRNINITIDGIEISVPHGSTITWRFKDSSTDGNFSGASYETQAATASVDCDPNSTISSSFGYIIFFEYSEFIL